MLYLVLYIVYINIAYITYIHIYPYITINIQFGMMHMRTWMNSSSRSNHPKWPNIKGLISFKTAKTQCSCSLPSRLRQRLWKRLWKVFFRKARPPQLFQPPHQPMVCCYSGFHKRKCGCAIPPARAARNRLNCPPYIGVPDLTFMIEGEGWTEVLAHLKCPTIPNR